MKRIACLLALLLVPLLSGGAAWAHPLAPALLELRESAVGRYEVLWRSSVVRARGREVAPQWPAHCTVAVAGEPLLEDNEAVVQRWTLDCPGGLAGHAVAVAGLERSGINVILRVEPLQGAGIQALLDAARPLLVVPSPIAAPPVFGRYLALGVEHLLFGVDHVLFVLGLLLLVRGWRALLLTITSFTLGHSLTLSLATLGLVRVNPALTELAIALSILLLAAAVLRPAAAGPSLLARWPWAMALGFGLLHGLGFAGALAEIGLPQREIPLALFAFNLGIELGQLALVVLAAAAAWMMGSRPLPRLARPIAAYVIGVSAAYWCFERGAAMLWAGSGIA